MMAMTIEMIIVGVLVGLMEGVGVTIVMTKTTMTMVMTKTTMTMVMTTMTMILIVRQKEQITTVILIIAHTVMIL